MNPRNIFLSAGVSLGVIGITTSIVLACGGTPRPNCFQTAWLAKFVPATIVLPTTPGPIAVPVGVLPYVLWNTNPACAQPSGASLDLTFTCTPAGGGVPIVIGPTTFPQPTPTAPGAQAVNGGVVTFTIPAGTLTPGTPYICAIAGTYTVSFAGGLGAPSVIGAGDTEVCLVPPSPQDSSIPRLDMRLFNEEGEPDYQACRRGDQTINWYLLENNDADHSATLSFSSRTNQVAGTPGGDNSAGTFFAISNPTEGADAFPQAIGGNNNDLIALPDPTEISDREVSSQITLAPNEIKLVGVAVRSFGMCADGSCGEVLAKVEGTFSDGSRALACAGTALLVDDQAGKSPLCEVTDTIKVAPTVDARWSLNIFDNNEQLSTHFAGNLTDAQGGPGTQTTGDTLREIFSIDFFGNSASDYLRTETPPSGFRYTLNGFRQSDNFLPHINSVTATGLGVGTYQIPFIYRDQTTAELNLLFDFGADTLTIKDIDSTDAGEDVSISGLPGSLPSGLLIDEDTCRTIVCEGVPDAPLLKTDPNSIGRFFSGPTASTKLRVEIAVTDARNGNPLSWEATSSTEAATLEKSSGAAGENIVVVLDPNDIQTAPQTTTGFLVVSNATALNNPRRVPIALRKLNFSVTQPNDGNGSDEDSDGDGIADEIDNCPDMANADQADADGDGFGDICDPAPTCANCGPMGFVGYASLIGGYGGGLFVRRRRRR